MSSLSFSEDAVGLIHGDFGIHNIFVNENQDISIFDFDLCGYGLKAFDIATFQVFLPWEDEDPTQINAFVKGYNKIRKISPEEFTAVKLFKNFIRTIWGMGYYITLAPILGLEYFEGELERILLRVTNRFLKELEDIST
ncbi:MAG: phosphotransferase [Candidatus Heimdallarchaeota archaeon]|nr:phosphotransferase [Candidatus Heimdallarchaeota archaeon]